MNVMTLALFLASISISLASPARNRRACHARAAVEQSLGGFVVLSSPVIVLDDSTDVGSPYCSIATVTHIWRLYGTHQACTPSSGSMQAGFIFIVSSLSEPRESVLTTVSLPFLFLGVYDDDFCGTPHPVSLLRN